MKYETRNEFDHFTYNEAQIGDIERTSGMLHIWLDNVMILPECSANRDIRTMRCNGMCFKIMDHEITSFIEEGYRYYNADGKLMREDPDREIAESEYAGRLEAFREGYVVSFECKEAAAGGYLYVFTADSNDEKTYTVTIQGSGDEEDWDRFLSL